MKLTKSKHKYTKINKLDKIIKIDKFDKIVLFKTWIKMKLDHNLFRSRKKFARSKISIAVCSSISFIYFIVFVRWPIIKLFEYLLKNPLWTTGRRSSRIKYGRDFIGKQWNWSVEFNSIIAVPLAAIDDRRGDRWNSPKNFEKWDEEAKWPELVYLNLSLLIGEFPNSNLERKSS